MTRRSAGKLTWLVVVLAGLTLLVWQGLGMRFVGCLLVACAGAAAWWRWASPRIGQAVRRALTTGAALAMGILLGVACYVVAAGLGTASDCPVDAVVILGAKVNGRQPSPILRYRLDAAVAYLQEHPDVPVVLSGGKGGDEEISEAECMRLYLEQHGVAPQRLLLEDASTNTAENFRYSREILQQQMDWQSSKIAVVTSNFHVGRALLAAEKYGCGGAVGVPADVPWFWLSLNYHLREVFAVLKTVIFD